MVPRRLNLAGFNTTAVVVVLTVVFGMHRVVGLAHVAHSPHSHAHSNHHHTGHAHSDAHNHLGHSHAAHHDHGSAGLETIASEEVCVHHDCCHAHHHHHPVPLLFTTGSGFNVRDYISPAPSLLAMVWCPIDAMSPQLKPHPPPEPLEPNTKLQQLRTVVLLT